MGSKCPNTNILWKEKVDSSQAISLGALPAAVQRTLRFRVLTLGARP